MAAVSGEVRQLVIYTKSIDTPLLTDLRRFARELNVGPGGRARWIVPWEYVGLRRGLGTFFEIEYLEEHYVRK